MIYNAIGNAIVFKKAVQMVNKRYGIAKLSQMHLSLMFAFCVLHRHGIEITNKVLCDYMLKYKLGRSRRHMVLQVDYLVELSMIEKDYFLRNTKWGGITYKVNLYKITPLLLEYMRDLELQMRRAYVSV